MESDYVSINWWLGNENAVHNGILFDYKKIKFSVKWMELENVMMNAVIQIPKDNLSQMWILASDF